MDLYILNFKHVLIILTDKEMRLKLLSVFEEQEIDVKIKFVNSYSEAATLINENNHDPFNHVILNLGFNNRKLNDFIEFIKPLASENQDYIIEYTADGSLYPVEVNTPDNDDSNHG